MSRSDTSTQKMYHVRDWDKHFENNRTRGLKTMQWVPVPNKQDGDGFTELLDHPEGPAHFGAWISILQVASKCNPRGTLVRDSGHPHDSVSLARMTHFPKQVIGGALDRLIDVGWLYTQTVDTTDTTQITHEDAGIRHDDAGDRLWNGMEGNGMETPSVPSCEDTASRPQQVKCAKKKITWSKEKSWENIDQEHRDRWKKAFPACDLDSELPKMEVWLHDRPTRAKKSNWSRFISGWLSRHQDRGGDDVHTPSAGIRPTTPKAAYEAFNAGRWSVCNGVKCEADSVKWCVAYLQLSDGTQIPASEIRKAVFS